MGEFHIQNSKIEQLNDAGDNIKITGNSSPVAVADSGGVVQTHGNENKVNVDQPKPSLLSKFWGKIRGWLFGDSPKS